jgi:peptidoglycan/LPS O-acetylase OafA/YrhL
MGERRHDIDWLRTGAILAVFLFHGARFFGGGDWHLQNGEESILATLFIGLLDLWIMPLFFLLSGAASWFVLQSRKPGTYLFERVKRLLVPLYITGVLFMIPPQAFFEVVTHSGFEGTFLEIYPLYFKHIISGVNFGSPLFIRVFYGHLWFLHFLFLISLVLLPLLLYLKTEKGLGFISRLAAICSRRGGIFLLLIPLVLIRIALTHLMDGEHTWEDFMYFAVYFLIGYIMVADRRFTDGFIKHQWLLLALGLLCFGGEVMFIFALRYNYASLYHAGGETFSMLYILFQIIMSLATFSWVSFLLSVSARYLNYKTPLVTYGNEAVLSFYILHQTVILIVGWFVIPLDMAMWVKYLIIVNTAFMLIIGLYELLVRRINVIRFFFGMRPQKTKT